jgi:hypothetical protein
MTTALLVLTASVVSISKGSTMEQSLLFAITAASVVMFLFLAWQVHILRRGYEELTVVVSVTAVELMRSLGRDELGDGVIVKDDGSCDT